MALVLVYLFGLVPLGLALVSRPGGIPPYPIRGDGLQPRVDQSDQRPQKAG